MDGELPLLPSAEIARKPGRQAKLRIVNTRTPEQWAEIIRAKWQDSFKAVMDTGLALSNSREELGKKEFWRMCREMLRYDDSVVRKLIQIGTNTRLMECASTHTLPTGWSILYPLTTLTDEQFQKGLDSGVIHPGMAQKDVAQLKPPKPEPETTPKAEPPLTGRELIERRTLETRKQIVDVLRELNPAEQLEFITLLRFQLDDLESSRKEAA